MAYHESGQQQQKYTNGTVLLPHSYASIMAYNVGIVAFKCCPLASQKKDDSLGPPMHFVPLAASDVIIIWVFCLFCVSRSNFCSKKATKTLHVRVCLVKKCRPLAGFETIIRMKLQTTLCLHHCKSNWSQFKIVSASSFSIFV